MQQPKAQKVVGNTLQQRRGSDEAEGVDTDEEHEAQRAEPNSSAEEASDDAAESGGARRDGSGGGGSADELATPFVATQGEAVNSQGRPVRNRKQAEWYGVVPDVRPTRKRTPRRTSVYLEREGASGGPMKYLIRIGPRLRERIAAGQETRGP